MACASELPVPEPRLGIDNKPELHIYTRSPFSSGVGFSCAYLVLIRMIILSDQEIQMADRRWPRISGSSTQNPGVSLVQKASMSFLEQSLPFFLLNLPFVF